MLEKLPSVTFSKGKVHCTSCYFVKEIISHRIFNASESDPFDWNTGSHWAILSDYLSDALKLRTIDSANKYQKSLQVEKGQGIFQFISSVSFFERTRSLIWCQVDTFSKDEKWYFREDDHFIFLFQCPNEF